MFLQYLDLDKHENILAYEIGEDYMKVQFADGTIYLYTDERTGKGRVDRMKYMAQRGYGLHKFIMNYAKDEYESKEEPKSTEKSLREKFLEWWRL